MAAKQGTTALRWSALRTRPTTPSPQKLTTMRRRSASTCSIDTGRIC